MSTWHRPFLEHLAQTGNVSASARVAGVSSSAVYNAQKTDADFAAAVDNAFEDAADLLEHEARRRAVQGVAKPVVYQGQLTPVWARDDEGKVVEEAYELPDGTTARRPVQAVDDHGRPVWLTVTEYSDSLLALLLKGRRKRVFADRTELTGADGGAVVMDDAARAARIAQLMAIATARRDGGDLA